ncbi:MAG: hypothetical protein S4CHLAM102_01610 [Chlamydiia bacterium]|nr:hypothetical protein [Chlamydiia bacterium]
MDEAKGIIALDIDGTITKDHIITDEVVDFLTRLHDEGWVIFLITGRTFNYAEQSVGKFNIPFYLGINNGSDIIRMSDKENIFHQYLDIESIEAIDKAFDGLPEDFLLYTPFEEAESCYIRPHNFSALIHKRLRHVHALSTVDWTEMTDFKFPPGFSSPVAKYFVERKEIPKFQERLSKKPPFTYSIIDDPIDSNLAVIMLTHKHVDKGKGLYFLSNYLQLPMTIGGGNDLNDLPLLAAATIGISVSDAPRELKEQADIICPSAKENGMIEGIGRALARLR